VARHRSRHEIVGLRSRHLEFVRPAEADPLEVRLAHRGLKVGVAVVPQSLGQADDRHRADAVGVLERAQGSEREHLGRLTQGTPQFLLLAR